MTDIHLVCSRHGEALPRMEEVDGNDERVCCPDCGYESQNFIKYPEATVWNSTSGRAELVNVLTGEKIQDL